MIKPVTKEAYRLFHEGSIALARCEETGIKIDTEYLNNAIVTGNQELSELRQSLYASSTWNEWNKRFGEKAKLSSLPQLSVVLFECEGHLDGNIENQRRDKTWTAEECWKVDTEFVKNIRKLGVMHKNVNTYLKGIQKHVCDDGRLRPSFNLNGVDTYRSSSSSPNFQNLPIRDPVSGAMIRTAFVADSDEYHIVEVDFSGLEVNFAYCYHKDPKMGTYLADPTTDMHRDMAAQLYMCDSTQVSKGMRQSAKGGFVFPQFYGDWWMKNATLIWEGIGDLKLVDGTPVLDNLKTKGINELGEVVDYEPTPSSFMAHVRSVERHFWTKRFPVYGQWKKDYFAKYQKEGGFNSLTGFRYVGTFSKNQVINYPVQGAAFHCLLRSLILMNRHIVKHKMKSRVVGQIHDSIVGCVHTSELDDYLAAIKYIMCTQVADEWKEWLIVDLDVEADVAPAGGNWHQKQEYKIK